MARPEKRLNTSVGQHLLEEDTETNPPAVGSTDVVEDDLQGLSAEELSGKRQTEWRADIVRERGIPPEQADVVMEAQMTNATGWLVANLETRKRIPLT